MIARPPLRSGPLPFADAGGVGVPERDDRVDADRQAAPLPERQRDVGGLPDAAVDVVDSVDPDRPVEAGEGARGGDRLRDRNGVVAGAAERHRLARVEGDGDDPQLLAELPEVVRPARVLEPLVQPVLEAVVEEDARREQRTERLHEVGQRRLVAVLVVVPGGVEDRQRRLREPPQDLLEVDPEEREVVDVRPRSGRPGDVPEEDAGRDAVRDQRADVGARPTRRRRRRSP